MSTATNNITVQFFNKLFNYAVESQEPDGLHPVLNLNYDPDSNLNNDYSYSDDMTSFYYKDNIEQLKKPWIREPHFIPLVLVYAFVFLTGKCVVLLSCL